MEVYRAPPVLLLLPLLLHPLLLVDSESILMLAHTTLKSPSNNKCNNTNNSSSRTTLPLSKHNLSLKWHALHPSHPRTTPHRAQAIEPVCLAKVNGILWVHPKVLQCTINPVSPHHLWLPLPPMVYFVLNPHLLCQSIPIHLRIPITPHLGIGQIQSIKWMLSLLPLLDLPICLCLILRVIGTSLLS